MTEPNRPKPDERLTAYLDGQLDQPERAEVQRLIETDSEWQRELAELEHLSRQLASLPRDEAPADLVQRTLERIHREPPVAPSTSPVWPGLRTRSGVKRVVGVLCGLAALLAAVMILPSLWNEPQVGQLPRETSPPGRGLPVGRNSRSLEAEWEPRADEYATEQTPSRPESVPEALPPAAEPMIKAPSTFGFDSSNGPTRSRAFLNPELGNAATPGEMEEELQRAEQRGQPQAEFFAATNPSPPVLVISVTSSDPIASNQDLVARLAELGWAVEPLAEDAFMLEGEIPPAGALGGASTEAESVERAQTGSPGLPEREEGAAGVISWFHVQTTSSEAGRVLQELQRRYPELRMTSRVTAASAIAATSPPWAMSQFERSLGGPEADAAQDPAPGTTDTLGVQPNAPTAGSLEAPQEIPAGARRQFAELSDSIPAISEPSVLEQTLLRLAQVPEGPLRVVIEFRAASP